MSFRSNSKFGQEIQIGFNSKHSGPNFPDIKIDSSLEKFGQSGN